jgi:hypothetical protein
MSTKLGEFFKKVVHKDKKNKTPETPPPNNKPAAVVLTKIQVTGTSHPYSPSIDVGAHEQFTAEGFYSDGTRKDLTGLEWSSLPAAVASVNAKGKASGKSVGSVKIIAKDTASGVSGSADLTVTEPIKAVLKSIAITPKNAVFDPKQTLIFEATGEYSNGAKRDLTYSLDWSSSDLGVAKMDTSSYCFMVKVGDATITAKDPKTGVQAATKVTVATPPADLQRICLQVKAYTYRGQLVEGLKGAATVRGSGAKDVHCPSKYPVSGEVFVWAELYLKAEGKVEFSTKPNDKTRAAPKGSASYKLTPTAEYLTFDAEQQSKTATVTAKTMEDAIKKAGAKNTVGEDIEATDLGNGQWEITWGTDVFDLKRTK